jgi:hypothetical protein
MNKKPVNLAEIKSLVVDDEAVAQHCASGVHGVIKKSGTESRDEGTRTRN